MISFQLLSCRVEVEHDDPRLAEVLRYADNCAQQPFPVRRTFRYHVIGRGPFLVQEEGDFLGEWESADDVLYIIYGRAYQRALERFVLSGWVVLHGAVVGVKGSRMLLLGDKGAGKSTLSARLLFSGHRVEGDELALERDTNVVAFPRQLHLKPGFEDHVPELRSHGSGLRHTRSDLGTISALDPGRLGFDWQLEVGLIDQVVLISPNHGGETRMEPLPPFEMIQKLMSGAINWGDSPGALVAAATRLGRQGGWQLQLGDPDAGLRALETAASA